jgi:hypothetical protein
MMMMLFFVRSSVQPFFFVQLTDTQTEKQPQTSPQTHVPGEFFLNFLIFKISSKLFDVSGSAKNCVSFTAIIQERNKIERFCFSQMTELAVPRCWNKHNLIQLHLNLGLRYMVFVFD